MFGLGSRLRQRGDRGAAAVEFALVVPLLLLLVFGIISYGVMLTVRQSVSQAAAEGARAAAVSFDPAPAARTAEASDAIDGALAANGVTCEEGSLMRGGTTVGACTVSEPAPCGDADATCVTVTLDYEYREHPIVPSFATGIILPSNLTYSATARVS